MLDYLALFHQDSVEFARPIRPKRKFLFYILLLKDTQILWKLIYNQRKSLYQSTDSSYYLTFSMINVNFEF